MKSVLLRGLRQKRIVILTDSNPFFVAQNRCLDGLDCHDWFIEFRKLLMIDGKALIEAFSQTMIKDSDKVNSFLDELNEVTTIRTQIACSV